MHLTYLPSAPHVLRAAAALAGSSLVQFQAPKLFTINTQSELPHYGWWQTTPEVMENHYASQQFMTVHGKSERLVPARTSMRASIINTSGGWVLDASAGGVIRDFSIQDNLQYSPKYIKVKVFIQLYTHLRTALELS